MKFLIICDYRENFENYSMLNNKKYNDHPTKKNISEIISAIQELGYKCEYFGGIPELIHAVDSQQHFEHCAFLNFTDGMEQNYSRVQAPALLEILNVPYSGSDVFPSALMNNKHFCKQALHDYHIQMAKSCIVSNTISLNLSSLKDWKFPLFVKPNCEGSSLGISQTSVCHTLTEVINKVNELLQLFDELIIEEFISGIDVTNYLIGNNNNYFINDVVAAKLYSKQAYAVYGATEKQNKLRDLYYNTELIPEKLLRQIQSQSILIANVIGARDICRIDYRLNLETSELNFIEINSAPRFSSTSEIGFIAQKRALSFDDMVKYYLDTFIQRI